MRKRCDYESADDANVGENDHGRRWNSCWNDFVLELPPPDVDVDQNRLLRLDCCSAAERPGHHYHPGDRPEDTDGSGLGHDIGAAGDRGDCRDDDHPDVHGIDYVHDNDPPPRNDDPLRKRNDGPVHDGLVRNHGGAPREPSTVPEDGVLLPRLHSLPPLILIYLPCCGFRRLSFFNDRNKR